MRNWIVLSLVIPAACHSKPVRSIQESGAYQSVTHSEPVESFIPQPKPSEFQPAPPPDLDPGVVSRGAYVSALAGCRTCHTPMKNGAIDNTLPFAGGRELRLPDGATMRTPNITPAPESGIGAWSDTELITAIRRGIRRDGEQMLPVMPYPYYHQMTDADAVAVVGFLRSRQPIVHHVARGGSGLALRPIELQEPVGNVDDINDPAAHGEYLAQLMHCGACHTPAEGPMANVTFAGGVDLRTDHGKITSANITNDPTTGIGQWTDDEIITAIRTGTKPDGTKIKGPMAMYFEGWALLEDSDARALVAYLRTVQPANHAIPERRGPVTSR